jgi:hypothetical protein
MPPIDPQRTLKGDSWPDVSLQGDDRISTLAKPVPHSCDPTLGVLHSL